MDGIYIHTVRRFWPVLVIACVLCVLVACGIGQRRPAGSGKASHASTSKSSVSSALKAQYKEWKGVRYKNGGLSKQGVDCSGFVFLTYKNRFGMSIPRTTKSLAGYGRKISRASLRPGDLVFFKTGRKIRHVGIYYGGNRFLHASSSNGIMLSRMDEKYWNKRYWQARRIM